MKLFVTGSTGYIGGEALFTIANAHPEYEITALVRNSDKGAQVASEYPKIKLVYGDLDSSDLIEEESSKADIVCHWADCDHEASAKAIVAGLKKSEKPTYLIHTSGTAILMYTDLNQNIFGESASKVHDDWDNIQEITTKIPDNAPHRVVDKIILSASNASKINTAIVCPPAIYGPGRGPGNKVSVQLPNLARCTLQQGHGIQIGAGKAYWTEVHVQDLSNLYLKLVEAAASGGEPATWNDKGYYFCEARDLPWGDVAQQVAQYAKQQGFIKTDEVKSYQAEESKQFLPWAYALWGGNSRCRAIRARKLLGWEATSPSLKEEIPATVQLEAEKLGLVPGHAKIAAGEA